MNFPRVLESIIVPGALVGLLVLVSLPRERLLFELEAPRASTARLPFAGTTTVSQTIRLPLKDLARVDIPVDAPSRGEAYPLILHLKESVTDRDDLRTFYVTEREAQKGRSVMTFRFFPPFSSDSPHELAIVLDAPNAQMGEFAVFHEIDASKYPDGQLLQGTRQRTGNIALQMYIRRPLFRLFLSDAKRTLLSSSLPEGAPPSPGIIISRDMVRAALSPLVTGLVGLAVGAIVVFLLLRFRSVLQWFLKNPPSPTRGEYRLLALLVVVSFALHLPYVFSYPAVNDEGAYLMDIANLRAGAIPFRDFLTKGPLFLTMLAPIALAGTPSLITARIFVVIASSINVLFIGLLARRLWGRAAGMMAAIVWAVTPAIVAQSTQVFLQPVELLFVSGALLLLIRGEKRAPRLRHAFFAGVILALAYLTRSSAIAFLPIAALLAMFQFRSRRVRSAVFLCGGFFLLIAAFSVIALPVLGLSKTAVLLNLEAFLVSQGRAETGFAFSPRSLFGDSPWDVVERTLRVGTSVIRAGYPILLFWFLMVLRTSLRFFRASRLLLLPLAGGILLWIRQPLSEVILGAAPVPLGWLFVASAVFLTIFALDAAVRDTDVPVRPARDLVLFGGAWIVLAVMYAALGRFRQHYHPEFLFVYTLGAALFLAHVLELLSPERRTAEASFPLFGRSIRLWGNGFFPAAPVLILTIMWVILGHDVTLKNPHAGNIPVPAAVAAARVIRIHTEPREEILTANALIPFLAERKIPFAMSHPGWYLEERAGTIPSSLRKLYFPDRDILRQHIEHTPVNTVVLDRRTQEVYFSPDPELEEMLHSTFRRIQSFEVPGERPLEIWKRIQ